MCDACGKYFEKHKVARPERVWNPSSEAEDDDEDDEGAEDDVEEVRLSRRTHDPRSTLPIFFRARVKPNPSDDDDVEPDTSGIPLPLRTFDPRHTLLEAYTHHLRHILKVRQYPGANVEPLPRRRRRHTPARYSNPLPLPHNDENQPASPPDEFEDDEYDLLIEEEGNELLHPVAKRLYDKLLWLDVSISMNI